MKRKCKHLAAAFMSAAALCGGLSVLSASISAEAVGIAQPSPKTNISDEDLGFYEALLTRAKSVADGECVSTRFVIPLEELNRSTYRYSAEDLGTALLNGYSISQSAYDAICEIYFESMNKAMGTLYAEAPYELFWYDGTQGYGCCNRFEIGYEQDADGTAYLTLAGSFEVDLSVSAGYAAGQFEVNPDAIIRAHDAVAYADSIIEKYEDVSDKDKLIAYKDEICALCSYNYDALSDASYGDAYQMIYVFDQDPDTNVVCEGYSKAFQYLCDNTEFTSDITCILATGYFCGDTDAYLHMWNVVSDANGNNFIADVTNTDSDSIGDQGDLFLKGFTSGSLESGYNYLAYGEQIPYIYDADTLGRYDADMLELAPVSTNFVCSEEAPAPLELKITAQPSSAAAAIGTTVSFNVEATGKKPTYQWQYNKGTGWKNSNGSGAATDTLCIKVSTGYNGYCYRCIITDKYGAQIISEPVSLKVNTVITAQPNGIRAAVGDTARFTVAASGAGLTYQWQYNNGSGWKNSNAAGAKTTALSINAKTTYNGWKYRCIITDANGTQTTSSVATLKIRTAITAQPADISAAIGDIARFTVKATGIDLTYRWQYNAGSGWKNSNAAGSGTDVLSISAKTAYNDYQYRCVITDGNGYKTISEAAVLTIKAKITAQPASVTVPTGTAAQFKVQATGMELSYQWQYNNGSGWKTSNGSGAKTDTLTINAKATYDGWKYRCVITDANGNKVISAAAELTLN